LIEVRGLEKSFDARSVLKGIDLDVRGGEILGYLGANGAGKTTTVRILTGLIGEFRGEVRVCGFDPRTQALEVKRRVGIVPETPALFEALTIAEFLLFVGRLHALDEELVRSRAEQFLRAFDLMARLNGRISSLSKGMRQKVMITSALLHDPKVVFLDEPLSGLDVDSTLVIKELMRGLAGRGRAVFYCSHVMDVVERVCDRIVILHEGRIAAQGSFDELKAQRGGESLERIFAGLTGSTDERERVSRILDALS
jgi:ABC-2 type transport system ATP-binding protein